MNGAGTGGRIFHVEGAVTISFDKIASIYDQWYSTPLGAFADEVETGLAFELFTVRPGEAILDAGCGTGNFSLKLARKSACVTGIDLAPGMLAVAREKAASEGLPVTFAQMDLCRLDYPESYFDGAASMAAFEFVCDPRRAFGEIMRALKPGGRLLIGTINRDSSWGALYREQSRKPGSIYRRARFMNMAELADLDRANLVKTGEALFIDPGTDPEKFHAAEKRTRPAGGGGFIAALWQKR